MPRLRRTPPDGDSIHYEVRCPRCNVSFAVGTKTCLHCGGRTAAGGEGPLPSLRQDLGDHELGPATEFDPRELERDMAEGADASRRSPFRFGMSSIWILLAAVGYLYRSCSGG